MTPDQIGTLILMVVAAVLLWIVVMCRAFLRNVRQMRSRIDAIAVALAWGMSRQGDAPREIVDALQRDRTLP